MGFALDLTHADEAGLGVLAALRDRDGHAITTLLFSSDDGRALSRRVRAVLARSPMATERIVGTVRLAIARRGLQARAKAEVA